ncbi:MAG: RluA family pseudouridine synthase [Candidatus Nomurabacteria bacterium]|jgi:23S rRNA pseudouridine1911/1915/1917 synthase|nr:RluA family pseudouridine synthase [Candidatus Nomurabacteria bacterium]
MSKQVKFTKKDIINLLWAFNQLEAEVIDDVLVQDIAVLHPSPENILLCFKFEGRKFFGLFDENTSRRHVAREIESVDANAAVEIVGEGIFKGKTVSLAKEKILKKRLDVLLVEKNPTLPRAVLQKYIKNGQVTVNGVVATRPSQIVNLNADVKIAKSAKPPLRQLDLPVLFEDDDVVVIEKPVGILAHSKGAFNAETTVSDWLSEKLHQAPTSNRFGIVHRLDRGTSGVMIVAKNDAAMKKLQKQFSARKTKKIYYALVQGQMKQTKALINLPIARNLKKPTTFKVDPAGRAAETLFEVVKESGAYSLLKLSPTTGRTHQLRVHLAYLGRAIVGDAVYGGEPAARMMLHAGSLEVTLPSGDRRVFVSKLPEEFERYVD